MSASSSSLSLSSSSSFSSHDTDEEIVRVVQNMQAIVAQHFAAQKKRKSKKKKKKKNKKICVHRQGIYQSLGRVSKSVNVASSSLVSDSYSSTASSATVDRSRTPVTETVAEQLGQADMQTKEDKPSLDQKNNDKKVTCNRNLEKSEEHLILHSDVEAVNLERQRPKDPQ